MVYDKYSANYVFEYLFANIICNKIMQALTDQKFDNLNDDFALGGMAADCFLNSSSGPIQNIQFYTDNREIYIFIAKNLKNFCPEVLRMETFEERIIAYFQGVYIEFYLRPVITTTSHLGIYVTTEITPE